jgi:predicted metal-dependent hydrolase
MATATTPADLEITPRQLNVDRDGTNPRWWHGGDPVPTAFFNALSVTFPQGETFFIEAVRRYRDSCDPHLQEQIAAFVQQEAMHTREHVTFNRLVKGAGYDTSAMEAYTRMRLDLARKRHPIAQLAMTVALEHFTAIMAHSLLADPEPLPGAPEHIRKLWQWHAIEEIEHKAVAYDTYLAATKDMPAWRRYLIRINVMLLVSLQFWRANIRHMADFFRQDGINTPRTWLRVLRYHFVKPGLLRKIFRAYVIFYRPGFHPWCEDDRHLIESIERQLAR